MQAKKCAEGAEHIRLAEKALKTGLMKWTPDYDSAGDDYSKAATCFKVAKAWPEALNALNRACDCYKECKQLYHAAKMLETTVLVCRDSGKLDEIPKVAERGGLLYRQHGSPESAAQLLEKAAKILEATDTKASLELYEKASETIMVEDRPKQAAELMAKVSRLQAKLKNWPGTIEALENTIKLFQESGNVNTAGRYATALVLVHVITEDVVAAAKSFNQWGGYCEPDQSQALNSIINGFSDEDGVLVKQGLGSGAIKNLDVEFTRMIKEIKVPEGGDGGTGLEAAAAAYGAQRAAVHQAEAVKSTPAPSSNSNEHSFGVDPVAAAEVGQTTSQREEEAKQQLEDEEDDEDGLC